MKWLKENKMSKKLIAVIAVVAFLAVITGGYFIGVSVNKYNIEKNAKLSDEFTAVLSSVNDVALSMALDTSSQRVLSCNSFDKYYITYTQDASSRYEWITLGGITMLSKVIPLEATTTTQP